MTPTIAIIGGGPCGLTLARLLECKNIPYIVYERDESESSNRAGGSLDIHPETGQRALREGGLFDEFKKYARYDDTVLTVSGRDGKRVFQMGQDRDAPEIDRRELREVLLRGVPGEKIRWGHGLTSVETGEDGRPVLKFANGVVVSGFGLVVGADGAWSKVRGLVTKATPQYSGKSFLESRINHDNPLYETLAANAGPGTHLSIGGGRLVVTQRQGDKSYRTYFGLQVAEDFFRTALDMRDLPSARDLLLTKFYADWSDDHKDLIRHATDLRAWPLYTLAPEDINWTTVQGVTLAGDAAHLAITNGEGVNLAMQDALELAGKIEKYFGSGELERAVEEYEAEMFPRGVATIQDGRAMAEVMFAEDTGAFLKFGGVGDS